MFTGIITDLGHVRAISGHGDKRYEIATSYDTTSIDDGASIACCGACLSVIEKGEGWFAAMVSNETLARTTLGSWREGSPVNLERAVKAGDELGGHIVSGHVDGTGEILSVTPDGESRRMVIKIPAGLDRQIAAKGSITIDGVSLTVNEAGDETFGVNIIPHTLAVTTFGKKRPGDAVNLEVDMLARYVARLLGQGIPDKG